MTKKFDSQWLFPCYADDAYDMMTPIWAGNNIIALKWYGCMGGQYGNIDLACVNDTILSACEAMTIMC